MPSDNTPPTTLTTDLRRLGLNRTADDLNDRIADATRKRWSPTVLLEHLVAAELEDRQRRSVERRLTRARLGRFKPLADWDWDWPTALERPVLERILSLDFLAAARTSSSSGPTTPLHNAHLAMCLYFQGFLARVRCYRTLFRVRLSKPRLLQGVDRDHPGSAFAGLSGSNHTAPDLTKDRHLADLETIRGLLQRQFVTLLAFTLAIDRDAARRPESAHTRFGPGVASSGPFSDTVEKTRDRAVGHQTSQFPNEVTRLGIRGPSVLAVAILAHRQFGVIAALPVQPQPDAFTLDTRNDLHEQRPHDAFAALRSRPFVVPGPLEVGAQRKILFAFVRTERLVLLARKQRRHGLLALPHDCQTFIPAPFQLAGHQAVVRVHGIVLSARAFLLKAGRFERQLRLTQHLARCAPPVLDRA